jgi:hypothetical protein
MRFTGKRLKRGFRQFWELCRTFLETLFRKPVMQVSQMAA